MKKITFITGSLMGALALASTSANVVPGYSQRYEAATLSGTTLANGEIFADSVDEGADGKAIGSFDLTQTTPNGSQAITNTGEGKSIDFSRNIAILGAYTIQIVVRVDSGNVDGRQGPIGFAENAGYGGVFAGINADEYSNNRAVGSIVRGGNLGGIDKPGMLEAKTTRTFESGTWGIYTIVVDPTADNQLTATFDRLSDGSNIFTLTRSLSGNTNDVTSIAITGRLFGGEMGASAADRTDEFRGAIADIVIYDSALDTNDLETNKAAFISLFQTAL